MHDRVFPCVLCRNYRANNSMSTLWIYEEIDSCPPGIYEKIDSCPIHQDVVTMEIMWLEAATLS